MNHHVAFCCAGEKGLRHLAVALLSLYETYSQPEKLRFHIVWENLSGGELDALRQSWAAFSDQVLFYRASEHLGEQAKEPKAGYWFRTYLSDILSPDIDRVFYLDYDVLVLRDTVSIWDVDVSSHAAAVVWDSHSLNLDSSQGLAKEAQEMGAEFHPDRRYFNSGVLLINLDRWRELDVGKTLTARFGKFRPYYESLHDQNELNILLQNEVLPLSPSWNFQDDIWRYTSWPYELYEGLGSPKEYFRPRIRHFAGKEKVDGRWRRASYKTLYYTYLDRTPWAGYRSDIDRSRFHQLMAQFLDLHCLVCRGLLQNSLDSYLPEMARLIRANPILLLIYPAVPVYRTVHRLVRKLQKVFVVLLQRFGEALA